MVLERLSFLCTFKDLSKSKDIVRLDSSLRIAERSTSEVTADRAFYMLFHFKVQNCCFDSYHLLVDH